MILCYYCHGSIDECADDCTIRSDVLFEATAAERHEQIVGRLQWKPYGVTGVEVLREAEAILYSQRNSGAVGGC